MLCVFMDVLQAWKQIWVTIIIGVKLDVIIIDKCLCWWGFLISFISYTEIFWLVYAFLILKKHPSYNWEPSLIEFDFISFFILIYLAEERMEAQILLDRCRRLHSENSELNKTAEALSKRMSVRTLHY